MLGLVTVGWCDYRFCFWTEARRSKGSALAVSHWGGSCMVLGGLGPSELGLVDHRDRQDLMDLGLVTADLQTDPVRVE